MTRNEHVRTILLRKPDRVGWWIGLTVCEDSENCTADHPVAEHCYFYEVDLEHYDEDWKERVADDSIWWLWSPWQPVPSELREDDG